LLVKRPPFANKAIPAVFGNSTHSIASTYTANDFLVYARCDVANNALGGARYVYFEVYFRDNKVQTGFGFQSGPQYDEVVQGTVSDTIRMLRPSGSNVAVSGISAANSVNLSDAQV
jgi:hypothetical protein